MTATDQTRHSRTALASRGPPHMGSGLAAAPRPGTTAEFFRILLGRSVPWPIAGGFALAAAVGAEAQTATPVEHFNYVLGT